MYRTTFTSVNSYFRLAPLRQDLNTELILSNNFDNKIPRLTKAAYHNTYIHFVVNYGTRVVYMHVQLEGQTTQAHHSRQIK